MNEFQQTFLRWLDLNRKDMAAQPIFDALENQVLRYRLENVIQNIALFVSQQGIEIDAFKDKVGRPFEAWGSLFKREACKLAECRLDDWLDPGLTCVVHGGREFTPHERGPLIVAEHCFAPLRDWIANELQTAHWLLFAETEHGSLAYLQAEGEDEPVSEDDGTWYARIPLRRRRRPRAM
jgi:hypothetical protein